jgi:AraC-like DNA-binding protein
MLLDKLLSNLSVHVRPFAICSLTNGWRLHLPGPTGLLLHFVLEGEGTLYGPKGDAHRLSPMHLAVVPSGAKHIMETTGELTEELRIDSPPPSGQVYDIVAGSKDRADLVIGCGLIDVRYGSSMDLFSHLTEILSVDLSSAPQALTAFRGIMDEQSQAIAGHDAMTAALMTQCLVHFFRRLPSEDEAAVPWITALQDLRLGRVVDAVLDSPGADHTIDSMAEVAVMSRSAFSSMFERSFGKTPMSFVSHIRMQAAAQMLEVDSASVDEIANSVGYASRSHFSRTFKEHMGLPPKEFRAEKLFQ